MSIINIPEIILNIFEYLTIEEYNIIINNDLEYFLKIINHEYIITKLWFMLYNSRINIQNIILDNIDEVPIYCKQFKKIIIKNNKIPKLKNLDNCTYLELYENNKISKIQNIILDNIDEIPIYCKQFKKIIIKNNKITKLKNLDNCTHLELHGNNKISKLENINKCKYLMINGDNIISKIENMPECKTLIIWGRNNISKLENTNKCKKIWISGSNTISKIENIENCTYLIINGNNEIQSLEEHIVNCKYIEINNNCNEMLLPKNYKNFGYLKINGRIMSSKIKKIINHEYFKIRNDKCELIKNTIRKYEICSHDYEMINNTYKNPTYKLRKNEDGSYIMKFNSYIFDSDETSVNYGSNITNTKMLLLNHLSS